MEILPGIEIKNKALWIKRKKVLIIADLHIGYEQALVEEGILVPRTMFKEIKKEIEELLKLNPKIVIINGDLKHEFSSISKQEWQETLELLDLLLKKAKVILVKGNHDTILEPIARKKNLLVKDFYCFDDVCVLHGHKFLLDAEIFSKKIKILVIAHDHPAISLSEGIKQEKYKCFLLGKYKDKKVIVMPSFLPFPEGADVKKEKMFSPFLKNVKNFDVFVLGDKVYYFGKVKDIE
ncbi:MAG: metallophosphoesterase [Candidatus Pacearchaeota archaeon]